MDMTEIAALAGLAFSAFLSATMLPGTSEVVLIALAASGTSSPLVLLIVATTANVAGSCVNWMMGMFVNRFRDSRWFPASPAQIARAEAWYARYGLWSLFLAGVPLIGDAFTLVAGILRAPLPLFIAIVALAKGARYVFILFVVDLF